MHKYAMPSWIVRYGNPWNIINPWMARKLKGFWLPQMAGGYLGGDYVMDIGPRGHNSEYLGSADDPWYVDSPIGPVLRFNGVNDLLGIPNHVDFDVISGTSDFTFFVRCMLFGDDDYNIASQYTGGNSRWYFTFRTNKIQFNSDIGPWEQPISVNPSASLDTWHDVVLRRNSSTWSAFLDGVQVGSDATSGISVANPSSNLYFGYSHGIGNYIDGLIAQILLWGRPLGDGEIRKLSQDFYSTMFHAPTVIEHIRSFAGLTDIQLNWTDNSDHEDGFDIERQTDGGAWGSLATGLAADLETYTDPDVTTGHTYNYRVKATSSALGDSEWSNEDSVAV